MTKPSYPLAADLYGDLLDEAPGKRSGFGEYVPGLTLALVAALAASWIAEHYGAPRMLMGLLIGLALNFANGDKRLHPGLGFSATTLLRWGIVFAGAQVTLSQIAGLGWQSFVWIAAMIAVVIAVGAGLGRAFRFGTPFGILAGGAVAICGASAALAIASLLGEKRVSQAQLTLVLVTIAAASAAAMTLYPALAFFVGLTDQQAGWFLGSAIHDVAQAMGAGYSVSEASGQTATIVKLTRVAMLAPALVAIALLIPGEAGSNRPRIGLPWFVCGFLAVVALQSFVALPDLVLKVGQQAAQFLLLLAVTATGIRSPMAMLLNQGWRGTVPVIGTTLAAMVLGLAGAMLLA